jgi:hypothetical protein
MNKITRYAVRMKNGDYMRQDLDDTKVGVVLIRTVYNPIDAMLVKDKYTAQRCVTDVLSGNTNLLCLYNDDNPPEEVVELKINLEIK